MNKEVWKDLPSYEGLYQVSNIGRVKSVKNSVRIRKFSIKRGYPCVNLSKNNKSKCYKVHQLVAMTYLNHKPCGMELVIDHINGIKTDNRLKNLQIITNRENCSKDKKEGSSKYTGVYFDNYHGRWRAEISINGRSEKLGYFENELEASNAYQYKLKKTLKSHCQSK